MARVLIADDDLLIATNYARVLKADGHDVDIVGDGDAALMIMSTKAFDAVVADQSMPQRSGIELLRALRELGSEVPFVLMTGDPAVEGAMRAMELGAARYLATPVALDDLRRIVSRLTSRYAREHSRVDEHRAREAQLANALATLHMVYQPIVSTSKETIVAYEALARNQEPALLRPDLLFDRAEEDHRLADLGRTVRERVALDAETMLRDTSLFVNIHVCDLLDDELYNRTRPLTRVAGRVVLEITERASLTRVPDLASCLERLRELGFRIAVDDLGAGYAGLASISSIRPDIVKLDMSLIRGVDRDNTKQRLVRSMIAVCTDLGSAVVCEGVETEAEQSCLIALGADWLQGYYFAKPARPQGVLAAL